jgi:hypothetical protein
MPLLKVDRTQFLEGIRVLDGMISRKRQAKAILKFVDGVLSITVAKTAVDVWARGEWSGTAKIVRRCYSRQPPLLPTQTLSR